MNTGPLRRATGLLGLVALAPIAFQFATGALAPQAAAARALAIAVVTVAVGRAIQVVVRSTLRRFEPDEDDRHPSPAARGTR